LSRLKQVTSQAWTPQWAAAAQDAIDRWYSAVNLVPEHQVPPAPGEKIMRIGDTWRDLAPDKMRR